MKKYIFLACSLLALNTFAINYGEFLTSGNRTENINIEKEYTDKIETKRKALGGDTKVELHANNKYFKSFLLITKDGKYKGITFDSKTGKEISLKDLFQKGYDVKINEIIKRKLKENFGMNDTKFNGISTWFHQEFFLDDYIINIILPDTTNVANKDMIVPIFPIEMRGLIK